MRARSDTSLVTTLTRLGFADPGRAATLMQDQALAGMVDPLDTEFADGLPDALSRVADPDLALLALVRIMERLHEQEPRRRDAEAGPDASAQGLVGALRSAGVARDRLLGVLGSSAALGDHLGVHPEHWRSVTDAATLTVQERTELLVAAVRDHGELTAYDALRVAYRQGLLGIAAIDVTAHDPLESLPPTAAALADLAEAALEAALVIAVDEVGERASQVRVAVIGMGKTGGRELNYISDVDVIFVAEPAEGVSEHEAMRVGSAVATALMQACFRATSAGSLWQVDAALRPEGKNGPLVRTVESHRAYYERWAKTWEFQALLKARVVAGDRELGREYLDVVQPMVWSAASRENFVEDVQAMRRRVEKHVPPGEADRQLKLGAGGLRDVEFSVQLLQLVHGRDDATLRSRTTLQALGDLATGGYVGRDDAAVLEEAYCFLRSLEHRIQLFRLRRTHLMPTDEADLRRLGRAMGHRQTPATAIVEQWRAQAREVRKIHERLFYRPLLAAVARLDSTDARLAPEAARDRLAALGFRDPSGAMRHLEVLTSGVSRRAAIQRTLLPVMLSWFADEADPDGGLLAFRKISEELGGTHWYLRLLRDGGSAAERLAHTLSRSTYAANLLLGAAEAVAILGDSSGLAPRSQEDIAGRMASAAGRAGDPDAAVRAARTIRRTELFRVAMADLAGDAGLEQVGVALTNIAGALLQSGLESAVLATRGKLGRDLTTRVAIIGMGRLGGSEMGYSSDADVMFVHDPLPGADATKAQADATAVVQELRRLLGSTGPDPQLEIDAGLRPEGKNGPLVRSLQSYRAYYERWSDPWEAQALLRARPVAGDTDLGDQFVALIDPIRWPADELGDAALRQIRRLKARMEAERLPRGADPKTHFKLGLGGLSDVEWTAQLLQLRHAHDVPGLQTTSTLGALRAAAEAGLVSTRDAAVLRESWRLASRMRNAAVLFRGRPVDAVPTNMRDSDGIGRIMGLGPSSGQQLNERYRRVARRARTAVDANFYDSP